MTYIPLQRDSDYNAAAIIEPEHYQCHLGHLFDYLNSINLNGTQTYLLTTPDTAQEQHLVIELDFDAATTFTFSEGADRAGTTLQTPYNHDRRSATTANMTIHKSTSGGTTDGTTILTFTAGGGTGVNKYGGSSTDRNEWILKRNTKYMITLATSIATRINLRLHWYEMTPP